VVRLKGDSLEHEKFERALREFHPIDRHAFPSRFDKDHNSAALVEAQEEGPNTRLPGAVAE